MRTPHHFLTRALVFLALAGASPDAVAAGDDHHHHDHDAAVMDKEAAKYKPTTPVSLEAGKAVTEEGGNKLTARVSHQGRPLKDVTVAFLVPRAFGMLNIGEMSTGPDGLAEVPFPDGLPGDARTGKFAVTARIVRNHVYLGESSLTVDGGTTLKASANPFPREIWSPNTDLYLLLTIPFLIGAVWSVYIFALVQLRKIVRLGRSTPEFIEPASAIRD